MADEAKDGGLRKAIVSGIVSGIVVIVFIQPILGFFWHFFLSNIKALSDSACFDAALGYTDRYGFLTETLFDGAAISFATGFLVINYSMHKKSEASVDTVVKRASRLMKSRLWATFYLIVVLVFSAITLGRDFINLQLNASFHQRLTILAPKISDQEYKEFLASWASMRNEEDYQRIVQDMESKAKSNGITLPKLLPGAVPSS
jgi:hypothetical protein